MMKNMYHSAEFLTSSSQIAQFPEDSGYEVAFAGRSNAGKSSALNTIVNQKGLARTSKTPGRTQLINFFQLDQERRLVDLPGYGYAKVAQAVKQQWSATMQDYLLHRACLRGLVILMDIRHPLKPLDANLVAWCAENQLPTHILLTKSDKLKRGAKNSTLIKVKKELSQMGDQLTVQTFSALKADGVVDITKLLNQWFGFVVD